MWIRLQLNESPVFKKMKEEGKTSKAPLTEAFGQWGNLRWVLVALLGAVAGQAVVWYCGQFYALFFLEKTLKVDGATANILIAIALALATPFFVFFGWLSDRIGAADHPGRLPARRGQLFPLFNALTAAANPAMAHAQAAAPVTVTVDQNQCSLPVRPCRQEQVRLVGLRHRQGLSRQGRHQLS